LEASVATRSKISGMNEYFGYERKIDRNRIPLTKEFRIDMARLEIPVSGWTCLRTVEDDASVRCD
jgi:hypothetical protein